MSRAEVVARKIVPLLIRHFRLVMTAGAAITACCVLPAANLYNHIDSDMANLLPDHYPSVAVLKELREKFRTGAGIILVVEGATPTLGRTALIALAEHLRSDPRFTDVEYEKPGYDFFDHHKLLYLDRGDLETIRDRIARELQRKKLGGLYVDLEGGSGGDEKFQFRDLEQKYRSKYAAGTISRYYSSDDGRVYSLYAKPAEKSDRLDRLAAFYKIAQENTTSFLATWPDHALQVYFTGPVRTRVEEYQGLVRDLVLAGTVSGIGVMLVLLLYFRRVVASALLMGPLTVGVMASLAFANLFIHDLNLITSFLFAILGGLGVEIGIHMLSRYLEERRAGMQMEEALVAMLAHTGMSALTSVATVAATFLILTINDFKGFSEFGLIAGVGLVMNYLCYCIFFPALLVAGERWRLLALGRSVGIVTARRPRGNFPRARLVTAGAAALTLVAIFAAPRIAFEWRFSSLKAAVPEASIAKQKQRLTAASVNNPAAVIIRSQAQAAALQQAVEQKMQHAETPISGFKSAFDLVPEDQAAKLAIIREIDHLLADETLELVKGEHRRDLDRFRQAVKETTLVDAHEIPERVRRLFWGAAGADTAGATAEQVAYINPLPTMEMDDGRNAIRFAREVGKIETSRGTFHPSSDAIVFAEVLQTMMRDGKRAVTLAFLCVLVIVWCDVRRLGHTLLIVAPIALGLILTGGLMVLFGIKLNFYNMVVIPTAVGTSIDNAIHLFHRVREEAGDLLGALFSTGAAALLSSLTNICGFLGLAFVNHPGLGSIGQLAIAGLVACLITTLVFFPAALQIVIQRAQREQAHHV